MKKLLKVLSLIIAFVSIALVVVFYFTSGVVDVGNAFFMAVKSDNIDEAYSFLSEEFKVTTNKSELGNFLTNSGLVSYKESNWSNRSVTGDKGELDGTITTKSGSVIPITMGFIKTENIWKIYSIRKQSAGFQTITHNMPSETEQVKLVDASMRFFAEAVNNNSMADFHNYISNLWQKQITIKKLDDIFGSFYHAGIDLTALNNYSPIFQQEAAIDEDGVLLLKGHYPVNQYRVDFTQRYIIEGVQWKLIGFHINVE